VQAAHHDICSSAAIVVRDPIRTVGGRDVNLDDHHVRVVIEPEALYVFILNLDLVFVAQVTGECGEAERREQRVLDWPP
jgi:hypothetical protein